MRIINRVGLGWCIGAWAGAASAQHPMVLDKLKQLDAAAPMPTDEVLAERIGTTANTFAGANKTCAPKRIVLGEKAPITGARRVLQGVLSGQLRNAWTVYASHEGCPEAEPVRYMVVQKGDGELVALQVNHGRTFANPSMMHDTSAQAALAALHKARAVDAKCTGENMEMGPTKVVSQSPDLGPEIFGVRYAGSWSEVWRFKTCSRAFDVGIDFTADGDGGAYTNIKADQVVAVE